MNITVNNPAPVTENWALVLLDGTEKDILGIWGPYVSEAAAIIALDELRTWPLDGSWHPMALKHFPSPLTVTTTGGYICRSTNHDAWPGSAGG